MFDVKAEQREKDLAHEITILYGKIERSIARDKRQLKILIQDCERLNLLVDQAKEQKPSAIGRWFMQWCPKVCYQKAKRYCKVSTWTFEKNGICSQQLRFLDIIGSARKKKPQSNGKSRVVRCKTWVYHMMKAKEIMLIDFEKMGGADNLTEQEKQGIKSHIDSLKQTLNASQN